MSAVAQKQDLADPEVVKRFVKIVRTERRLIALYLITVADIRGTSPKVWNAWKGKLLEDLFHAADRHLRGENITFDNDIRRKQEEALRLLRRMISGDNSMSLTFCVTMPRKSPGRHAICIVTGTHKNR
jgi:[protein-PII] uridylyltransferase